MSTGEPVTQVPGGRLRLPEAPTDRVLLAKYFRAVGNPTRLEILELLREDRELSVQELVERLGSTQPQVSNHLACLRWCGFVSTRREHRTIRYRLADERVEQILTLARSLLADNAEHVAACRIIDGGRRAAGRSPARPDRAPAAVAG